MTTDRGMSFSKLIYQSWLKLTTSVSLTSYTEKQQLALILNQNEFLKLKKYISAI